MTVAEIVTFLNALDAENKALKLEVADLKTKQIPTGVVDIVINGVDMSKVSFT